MTYDLLPVALLLLLALPTTTARPELNETLGSRQFKQFDVNPNGSTFIWLPQHEYSGKNFFDQFSFFSDRDPTNGQVNYVNRETAFAERLAYVQDDGVVIMQGDNTTWLAEGAHRSSVRITSNAEYNGGLFILDVNKIPWGCAIWPAFWTLGTGAIWPANGEIDIIEGVHDNEHNQVAWHTNPGCKLSQAADFTGSVVSRNGVNHTDCNGLINDNAGCGVTEWSRASYGGLFDTQGGGVFAMKWDENSIAVYSFYRAAVPIDITQGVPNPDTWARPSAELLSTECDIPAFFKRHQIIFDITFCGDWAGNSYATTTCPGTCMQRLMDPNNFVNATWSINSLKVYRKQALNAQLSNAFSVIAPPMLWNIGLVILLVLGSTLL